MENSKAFMRKFSAYSRDCRPALASAVELKPPMNVMNQQLCQKKLESYMCLVN